jgi:hypothetical protein
VKRRVTYLWWVVLPFICVGTIEFQIVTYDCLQCQKCYEKFSSCTSLDRDMNILKMTLFWNFTLSSVVHIHFSFTPVSSLKHWYSFANLHGITSQKTIMLTVTTMKTSNITWIFGMEHCSIVVNTLTSESPCRDNCPQFFHNFPPTFQGNVGVGTVLYNRSWSFTHSFQFHFHNRLTIWHCVSDATEGALLNKPGFNQKYFEMYGESSLDYPAPRPTDGVTLQWVARS